MTTPTLPQLPGLAWGMKKSPVWSSRVQKSVSGKRQAISYMSYPIYRYTINFNVLRNFSSFTELSDLEGFFNSLAGQVGEFLFVDPVDAAVTSYQAIGIGDGANQYFQLVRAYGGFVAPVNGAPVITSLRKDGVAQTLTTNYVYDEYGLVTMISAPASGKVIDWTGTFKKRCAFTQDSIDLINDGVDIWKSGQISFETVKS